MLDLNTKMPGPNGSIPDDRGAERLGDAMLTMSWCRTTLDRAHGAAELEEAAVKVKRHLNEWFEKDGIDNNQKG